MAERRTFRFSGEVQGVGFRATTQRLARGTAVVGTVRNLPDGRVELVAEGEAKEIDLLIGEIRDCFGSMIREVDGVTSPATGDYAGFSILR